MVSKSNPVSLYTFRYYFGLRDTALKSHNQEVKSLVSENLKESLHLSSVSPPIIRLKKKKKKIISGANIGADHTYSRRNSQYIMKNESKGKVQLVKLVKSLCADTRDLRLGVDPTLKVCLGKSHRTQWLRVDRGFFGEERRERVVAGEEESMGSCLHNPHEMK